MKPASLATMPAALAVALGTDGPAAMVQNIPDGTPVHLRIAGRLAMVGRVSRSRSGDAPT